MPASNASPLPPRWAVGGWLFDKSKSGLLPFDLHIHDLDVIVSLFGKPESFTVNSCKGRDKTYAEHLRIDYNYGDKHVNGEAAWFNADSPWTARWRVYFENALVINDGTTMTAYSFDAPPESSTPRTRWRSPPASMCPPAAGTITS